MLPGKLKGVDRRLVSNSHGVVMQTGTGFVGTKFETEMEVFIPNILLKSTDGKLAWYRRLLLIPWGIKRIVTWEAHLKVSIVKAVTGARSSWGRAWQRGCKIWRFSSIWRFIVGPSSVNERNRQAEILTYSNPILDFLKFGIWFIFLFDLLLMWFEYFVNTLFFKLYR